MGHNKSRLAVASSAVKSGDERMSRQMSTTSPLGIAVDGQDALEQVLVRLAESASLESLIPEIRSAVNKARQHDQTLALNQALSQVADQGIMPFMLLSESGAVSFSSPAARVMIARVPGLTVHEGRLVLSPAELDQALRHAIARGRLDADSGVESPENIVRVPRGHGQAHMQLLVRPLSAADLALQAVGPGYTAIFFHDPDAEFEVDSFQLAALFDLSYAEARVTALLSTGKSLAAIAEHLHLSIHTVRTELKSVFRKTDTCSQAELVKLVLTSPAYRYGKVMLL